MTNTVSGFSLMAFTSVFFGMIPPVGLFGLHSQIIARPAPLVSVSLAGRLWFLSRSQKNARGSKNHPALGSLRISEWSDEDFPMGESCVGLVEQTVFLFAECPQAKRVPVAPWVKTRTSENRGAE